MEAERFESQRSSSSMNASDPSLVPEIHTAGRNLTATCELSNKAAEDGAHDDSISGPSSHASLTPSVTSTTATSVTSDCDREEDLADGSESQSVEWSIRTKWDLFDPNVLIRFLVYAFMLSKYKQFCRLGKGETAVIGARLDPEADMQNGIGLMGSCWKQPSLEYKPANVKRIVIELRSLQEWLSNLSCAWIQSLAHRSYIAPSIEP